MSNCNKNFFLKIKPQKALQNTCKFMLALLVVFFFIIQFRSNFRWGYGFFGRYGNLCTIEQAWAGGHTRQGGLAAYSVFLRKHLFTEADPEQVLVVPDWRKTNVSFAEMFWLYLPPIYLFPSKIKVSANYQFEISAKKMKQLKHFKSITSQYKNLRFYLLIDLDTNNYSKWALYINEKGGEVHIFTLPFDYPNMIEKI